jgi:hypothetical protein
VRIGHGQQAGLQRRRHLRGAAAFHGDRHQLVAAQQADERGEVELPPARFRQRREVDHQRVLVEEVGNVAKAGFEFARQGDEVGGLEQQGHQGQVGALDFKGGGSGGLEGNGHRRMGRRRPAYAAKEKMAEGSPDAVDSAHALSHL